MNRFKDQVVIITGATGPVGARIAAAVTDWAPWPYFVANTIESTRCVCDAMIAAGCRRLIHVSAVGVYGRPRIDDAIAEHLRAGKGAFAGTPDVCLPLAVLLGIGLASVYGASDEWRQRFVPNRSCDVWDWTADTAGAAIAITAYCLYESRRRQ